MGLALTNAEGSFERVNAAFASAFEYEAGELIGQTLSLLFPTPLGQDPRVSFSTPFDMASGPQEFTAMGKGGHVIFGEAAHALVGALMLHTLTSVKTRKRGLDDESVSLALRSSQTGPWTRDLTRGVVDWSPELEEIFGFSPGEFPGQEDDFLALIVPEDRPKLSNAVAEAIQNHTEYQVEFRFQHRNGEIRWMDGRGRAFYDSSGAPVFLAGVGIDITDRKRAELALRRAQERLRIAMDGADIGIWEMDLQTRTWRWSDLAKKHLDLNDQAEVSEAQFLSSVHEDDRGRLTASIQDALVNGVPYDIEFRTAGEKWIVAKGHRLLDASENPIAFLGITLDVTEQREAQEYVFRLNQILEQRVRERTEELEAANREMEGFTYTVSHDLRAPLRAIIATSKIVLEEYAEELPKGAEADLLRQAAAAKRLGVLIDDLLKLSRLSRQHFVRAEFDYTKLVSDVGDELDALEFMVVQPQMSAHGDPKLLRFAVQNFVENSLKFAAPSRPLRIEVGCVDGTYFVRDNGIGFDQAYVQKIFLPFERLHLEHQYPGTGIGLANVKRIIERHGGKVWAEGREGEGSAFYFTLTS